MKPQTFLILFLLVSILGYASAFWNKSPKVQTHTRPGLYTRSKDAVKRGWHKVTRPMRRKPKNNATSDPSKPASNVPHGNTDGPAGADKDQSATAVPPDAKHPASGHPTGVNHLDANVPSPQPSGTPNPLASPSPSATPSSAHSTASTLAPALTSTAILASSDRPHDDTPPSQQPLDTAAPPTEPAQPSRFPRFLNAVSTFSKFTPAAATAPATPSQSPASTGTPESEPQGTVSATPGTQAVTETTKPAAFNGSPTTQPLQQIMGDDNGDDDWDAVDPE